MAGWMVMSCVPPECRSRSISTVATSAILKTLGCQISPGGTLVPYCSTMIAALPLMSRWDLLVKCSRKSAFSPGHRTLGHGSVAGAHLDLVDAIVGGLLCAVDAEGLGESGHLGACGELRVQRQGEERGGKGDGEGSMKLHERPC